MTPPSTVHIVDVHPDLLGTYGDGGNAVVLAQRLRWRGQPAEVHRALSGRPIPALADIYCLGGGEDGPQAQSAGALAADGSLGRAQARGAVILAVCAGFQIAGQSFAASDGTPRQGLGLVDVTSVRGTRRRAVGELLVDPSCTAGPDPAAGLGPGAGRAAEAGSPGPGWSLLSGYENHAGVTRRGPGVAGLGRVLAGVGNGGGDPCDGAVAAKLVGTYLHGPVLARNPALADLLLSWVIGPLSPLDDAEVDRLRSERLAAVRLPRLALLTRRRLRAPALPWGKAMRVRARHLHR